MSSRARVQSLDEAIASALAGLPAAERPAFQHFVEALAGRGKVDDADLYRGEDLLAVAGSLWELGAVRMPGQPALRVILPAEAKALAGAHTLIQIITDDMHFLVESVLGELNAAGLALERVLHPVVEVVRDANGRRTDCLPGDGSAKRGRKRDTLRESVIHVEVEPLESEADARELETRLVSLLGDVRIVVDDWPQMQRQLDESLKDLARGAPGVDKDDLAESVAFLKWIRDDHFTFLGVRDYEVVGGGAVEDLKPVAGSGLGILRDETVRVLRRGKELVAITPEVRAFLMQPVPIIITKANVRSHVHRRVHMDYIGVKIFDRKGNLAFERRFVGLFTSAAYTRNTRDIPLLGRKVDTVIALTGFTPRGHDARAILNILETYPRDELFQASSEELLETALGILKLSKRPRPRLFVRYDKFNRFVSVLFYAPRERYAANLRERVGAVLADAFKGEISAFYPNFGDSPMARVHFIIRLAGEEPAHPDITALETRIAELTRNWRDVLEAAVKQHSGDGLVRVSRYGTAFSAAYQEAFTAEEAVKDVEMMERLREAGDGQRLMLRSWREADDAPEIIRAKLYHLEDPITLSDALPVFENMGLKVLGEAPYRVCPVIEGAYSPDFYIHDLTMQSVSGHEIALDKTRAAFEDAFLEVWEGRAESDAFNALVLTTGLPSRQITILRALARYLRQAGIAFSFSYIARGLANNPEITARLVALFEARFDPLLEEGRAARADDLSGEILAALDAVNALDEDRIIRRMMNLIQAMKRTNYYQRAGDGGDKPYLSFKFASQEIDELPLPKPHAEIFVYSPQVEGVHLRGGKVARGGLRWSDRREDFRTEVLGLVKAQQVKNAVIVPVGAKGGFYPKRLPLGGSRDEVLEEGIASYKTFISGLLDITDTYQGSEIRHPENVVRHDEDDPYLVVAADKGTATFSDIANDLAVGRTFCLGDAFASGGSAGYDHKKMGITARGAWEAVKRHFREMGHDTQSQPFSVIGVGDMSGDVFGNGMLLSDRIRLIAAFDHRDIFIDPDPDPAKSFAERRRLFETPRSSWQDYNDKLISRGGGVFSRRLKSIELSEEMRAALGTSETRLAPNELIRVILKSPADLLWFGGIGTYVKAREESDAEVGDRTNDAVRIDAGDLRVRVIGEGANLGLTQLARIAFARHGGRVNTDAIDNSAGVDSSDHEVNLKILLNEAMREGRLAETARNALLAEMTDAVAALVLKNNYEQTLALTLAEDTAAADLDAHGRFMRLLERDGRLNRMVEQLPDEETMRELGEKGSGLTRPEIAVLFAYAKIWVYDALIASDVPDDPLLICDLISYFPQRLHEPYREDILAHRLAREIIATQLANDIVNMGGLTFVSRAAETAAAPPPLVARGYATTREVFGLRMLHERINDLDLKVPADVQTTLHQNIRTFLRRQTLWFLRRHGEDLPLEPMVARYCEPVSALCASVGRYLVGIDADMCEERFAQLTAAGVPEDLAHQIANLLALASACDIVDLSAEWSLPLEKAAGVYFRLGAELGMDRLRAEAERLRGAEHWERLAIRRVLEDLFRLQRDLAGAVVAQAILKGGTGLEENVMIATWKEAYYGPVSRTVQLMTEMSASGAMTTAKLTLAVNQFRDLLASPAGRTLADAAAAR